MSQISHSYLSSIRRSYRDSNILILWKIRLEDFMSSLFRKMKFRKDSIRLALCYATIVSICSKSALDSYLGSY